MISKRTGLLRAAAVLLPSLLVMACGRGGGGGGGPEGLAELRVAHVASDAPAVDVFVDNAPPAITNLAFGEGTDFLQLSAGAHRIDIAPTGTPISQSVINIPALELAPDAAYTIAAFGRLESLGALVIEEETEGAGMNVRVRAIHVAPDVGIVDLSSVADGVAPTPLVADLAYGGVSDVLEVDPAPFVLGVDADDDATPDLFFQIPALPAGTTANVYALSSGVGNVFLLVQTGPGELARIDPTTTMPPPPLTPPLPAPF